LLEGGGNQHLEQALEALLDATAATTVFLERNVERTERGFCSSMIWERGEADAPEDNPWTLVRWVDRPLDHASLSIGKPFVFVLEDITGVEREPYEGLQYYAEANYPVISDGHWVGQVGFSYKGRPVEDEYHVLTAVVGLSSELASSLALAAEKQRSMARIIEEQASDTTAIVEDLLVAGRADGQVAVVPIDVSVYEVITGVLKTFNESGFVVGGDQISVKADLARLRQILRNLIGNAAKYGGESRSIVSGTFGGRGFIDVIDDGAGVDVIHVERIFDPYERAHPIELYPGSVGLGLAVSRRLARLMGGDVEYRREGGRTMFRLTLPLADSTTS
jgi:two-component sensor histidine kinase